MTSPYARPRRRHRGLRTLAVVLVVLLVLLLVLDRVGVYVAERYAADTIQSSQHLDKRPDVDIHGFPFLTQLATASFDEITVTASDVPLGQSPTVLNLSRMAVVLNHMDVSRDLSSVHAATGRATASATYADLSKALGVDVTYGANGRIKAAKGITVLGQTLNASISVQPELVNGALAFGAPVVNGVAGLGGEVLAALQKIFKLKIPLSGIPFGVRVTGLSVAPSGVVLRFAGSDLTYARGSAR